jgi:hypothetical protein
MVITFRKTHTPALHLAEASIASSTQARLQRYVMVITAAYSNTHTCFPSSRGFHCQQSSRLKARAAATRVPYTYSVCQHVCMQVRECVRAHVKVQVQVCCMDVSARSRNAFTSATYTHRLFLLGITLEDTLQGARIWHTDWVLHTARANSRLGTETLCTQQTGHRNTLHTADWAQKHSAHSMTQFTPVFELHVREDACA